MDLVGALPVETHLAAGVLAKPYRISVVEVLYMSSKIIASRTSLENILFGANSTGVV